MKKLFLLCMAIALTGVCSTLYAQNKSALSDKTLSAEYKQQITVLNSEIKTVRIKLKGDPKNSELRSDLDAKQAELKDVKGKKKVIDDAIKNKAASEKAAKNAEKAAKKAEKAQQKADRSARDAQKLKEKEK